MRTLLSTVAAAATLGVGGTALAGCGGDETVDFANAAETTAAKGTARVTLKTSIEGAGIPLPVTINAKGVTALGEPKGAITLDFGSLLGLAGAPAGTPSTVDMRFDGGLLNVKVPKLPNLPVPGGKPWVTLDLPKLATALGLPAKGLGVLFTIEPAAQLRALQAAEGLKEVGKEDVAGTETTHFRGTYKVSDYIAGLPADKKADAQAAVDALKALPGGAGAEFDKAIPADLWVDEDGVTRKLSSTSTIPGQNGQPGGKLKQEYVLSDFGVALGETTVPDAERYDATDDASKVLKSALAGGGTQAG